MNRIFSTLFTFLVIWICSSTGSAESWRGIVPLKSTRSDVENILSASAPGNDFTVTYHLKKEKVIVNYSRGRCEETDASKWDVAKDTVLSLSVYPIENFFMSDLAEDLTLFERIPGGKDQPETFRYINATDGMSVYVDSNTWSSKETIIRLGYFPPSHDDSLKCLNHRNSSRTKRR